MSNPLQHAARSPGAYRLEEQIGFLLRKASQRHIAIFARHISELTPPQFAALAMLKENGPTSQNQLGQLIAMDAATIKGVIGRLKARGLVAVARDNSDKRRLMVCLTDGGAQAVDQFIPLAARISRETLAPLNHADAETLRRLLAKIA